MKNIILLCIVFLFSSCVISQKGTTMWVNSHKVSCTGVAPMECLLVQKTENVIEGEWKNFYSNIYGFEFEPGYIYKLIVKEEKLENVPADASSVKYTLIEMLEKKEDTKLLLNGKWDALKINGSVIKQNRMAGAAALPSIQIDVQKNRFSGFDGCNNLSSSIEEISATSIDLGNVAGTRKMCMDMTIADAFNKALVKVNHYALNGKSLVFYDEADKEVLEFIKGTDAKILINDIWVVEIIGGEPVSNKTNAPSMEVNSKNLTVMGSDGCNSFTGKLLRLDNNYIEFGPLAGTKKMCRDMTDANRFNQKLANIRSYKIANLKLKFFDSQGKALMVLQKVD